LFGLALVLSPAYWIGNQAIIQRSLAARSEFEAKASYIWGALLKNLIPVIVAVPGLIAVVRFPELADQDQAVPQLVALLLPAGLRGIFVAAFLAALMSSIDSYLNSAATIFTQDLYQRFLRPAATPEHLLRIGRLTTIVLVLWGIGFAMTILYGGINQGVYDIFQTLMAFFQGPALAVLLAGLFWRRATSRGAMAGFLGGVLLSVSLYTLNQPAVYESLGWSPLFQIAQPYLYFSVWSFLTAAGLIAFVSLLMPREPEEKTRYVVYRRKEGSP
jgi:SSS family solute:Na+ symporter